MNQTMFIIDFPIISPHRKNNGANRGYHRKQDEKNGLFFLHGNGCRFWQNCLTCPKPDCDWQPYPKPHKKGRVNEGK